MVDLLAVGVLVGGASLYLCLQVFGRQHRKPAEASTCGCGGPSGACQTTASKAEMK